MDSFSKPAVSRRALLRGAGALLALPFLESLPGLARAAAGKSSAPPLRLGIFSVTGGTVLESWKPAAVGKLDKLPSILRPLDFAKDQINILTGLSHLGQSEGLNGHEHCAMLHLTGASKVKKENGKKWSSISIDQAVAGVVGGETYLPSLEMGLASHETMYSFRAPDAPVPYEANPRLVYERMFRGRKPVVPNWARRSAALASAAQQSAKSESSEQSVIDLVLDQAKALRGKLTKTDQYKLDEYLHSVRSVEQRIAFVEARHHQEVLDEAAPGPSKLHGPLELPKEGRPIWEITHPVERDPEKHADYIRLMSDLLVIAFQTDTTRVSTMALGSDEASFPGVVTVGYERHCHTLEHQGNASRVEDADPIAREACRQIHAWYTRLFAEFLQKLQGIDEGGSSLLDNSLILYTSYMADGGHGREDYPVLLAGKGGGRLETGRHLAYQKNTPMSNLYLELLQVMGSKATEFGDSHTAEKRAYEGRLPGLFNEA